MATRAKRSIGQVLPSQFAAGPMARIGPPSPSSSTARASISAEVKRYGGGGSSCSVSRAAASMTLCTGSPVALRCTARRSRRRKVLVAEPRMSMTRAQWVWRTWFHSDSQWPEPFCFCMTISRSSPGTSANSGAAAGPTAMVNRAPGAASASFLIRPDASTASPIREGPMKRIGKGLIAIGTP